MRPSEERKLRRHIREVMNSSGVGWQSTGDLSTAPVSVSAVVDPSASKTDPGNQNFVPRNRMELKSTISSMIDDISDDDAVEFYSTLKDAIDSNAKEKEKDEKKMRNNKHIEERVRRSIRKMLRESEAYNPTGMSYSGPVVGRPSPRAGYVNCDTCEGEGDLPNGAICPECKGKGQLKDTGRKNTMMTDVSGATFDDIAKELGLAGPSGARKAVDLALEKAKFVATMDQDELDIIVLTAMNDYVEQLNRSGELTPADVKLLKDHPNIVSELDGFREFLDGVLRKVRKPQKVYNPVK